MNTWTLMFYFASDNPLAPGIVSQLKALKNAGYHPNVNVIAYFDPQTSETPTHIFDINAIDKREKPEPRIGFKPNDPFVRNLMLDKIWGDELDRDGSRIRETIQRLVVNPRSKPGKKPGPGLASLQRDVADNGQGPKKSLEAFLKFCASEYKADHYMLFIIGHGLVVGDDVFLFDEHAEKHSVTLKDLGEVLGNFKDEQIKGADFDLVSFHSCSMSSLEVAYELKGKANYMLASQSPAFIGSWPYTQILIRLFNDLKRGKASTGQDVEEMLKKIFFYVLKNSTDFMLAGYSFHLCLSDLRTVAKVKEPVKKLVAALNQGMTDPIVTNAILLAHWKSQSYFQENYTDLYDFCDCLLDYCRDSIDLVKDPKAFQKIEDACLGVQDTLEKRGRTSYTDNPVVLSEFAGPDSQFSHGFSVFFPWSRPTSDRAIMKEKNGKTEYERYEYQETGWFDFLKQYWGPKPGTMRSSFKDEVQQKEARKAGGANKKIKLRTAKAVLQAKTADLFEDMASLMFNADGPLNNQGALNGPGGKTTPPDPTGDENACGSIKNYVRDTRVRGARGRSIEKGKSIAVSSRVFAQQKRKP